MSTRYRQIGIFLLLLIQYLSARVADIARPTKVAHLNLICGIRRLDEHSNIRNITHTHNLYREQARVSH